MVADVDVLGARLCYRVRCHEDGTCHGSTGSPLALSEEDSKGGRDGSRGEQGSSQRYWILYLANSRESVVSSDCIVRVRGVPCDPDR